jgi:uncharacterized protein YidB (DUF937 family)
LIRGQGQGGGLGEILERFRQAGAGKQADSWVRQGPNEPIRRDQVEKAIDPETLEQLSRQTGMSREELLERITADLPDAVDKMTPQGQVPDQPVHPAEPNLLDDVPGPSKT